MKEFQGQFFEKKKSIYLWRRLTFVLLLVLLFYGILAMEAIKQFCSHGIQINLKVPSNYDMTWDPNMKSFLRDNNNL